jgi:hypothetical protein
MARVSAPRRTPMTILETDTLEVAACLPMAGEWLRFALGTSAHPARSPWKRYSELP